MTRTDKKTGDQTVLTMDEAVEQFIIDNLAYAGELENKTVGDIQDYLSDMSTVFETRSVLEGLEDGEEADTGISTYKK